MSYIDQFRHELVGLFGDRPVYRPLEDIPGRGEPAHTEEFSCSKDQLVIGGGPGEYPGLVVRKPVCAVATFLNAELGDMEEAASDRFDPAVAKRWDSIIEEFLFQTDVLDFRTWRTADHVKFHTMCTSSGMAYPFDGKGSFEEWLMCSIGAFVFYAMPELAQPILSKVDSPYDQFRWMSYPNILIVPPNMPVYANGGNAWVSTRRQAVGEAQE